MSPAYIFTFILVLIYIVFKIVWTSRDQKKHNDSILNLDIDQGSFDYFGVLTCGHPDIDGAIRAAVATKDKQLLIFAIGDQPVQPAIAKIPMEFIKNINVEDASTVKNRVTVGRLLAVGVFAFAWTKKEVKETSYLVIEWNDGRFDHETVFEFVGKDAVNSSNQRRNKLIRALKV